MSDFQDQLHRLLRPNWGSINQFAQELYSVLSKKPQPGSAMSAVPADRKAREAAAVPEFDETGERTAESKERAVRKERESNPILAEAAQKRLEVVKWKKAVDVDPSQYNLMRYQQAQDDIANFQRLEDYELERFQGLHPDLPTPQWNHPETEAAYDEEAARWSRSGQGGQSPTPSPPPADSGPDSQSLNLRLWDGAPARTPALPAHVKADISPHSAPGAVPTYQGYSGKEKTAGELPAIDGPVYRQPQNPEGGYYDLRLPFPDTDDLQLPVASAAGVSSWMGKTTGGSQGLARVVLYPEGPKGPPADRPVDVVIAGIRDDEEIPAGIWVSPIFQGNKGTADRPELYYYAQLPVWLP
jgi:hypothetical protein